MGSSSSKPAGSAARAVSRRQYPKNPTPATTTQAPSTLVPPETTRRRRPPGPVYHAKEQPSTVRSEAIDLDARDPTFAASLRSIGPVTPNPTLSHSSTFNATQKGRTNTVFPQASNPALLVWSARQRITKEAELEAESFGKQSYAGREYLDALTIRQALSMRDRQGLSDGEIEGLLRLKKGVLGRLGKKGVFSEVG
ncbi:hypothetical protein MPDQ_005028 [Monascus purpureus]|uniref:Helix-turn-helix domain-containing protein n=1 Tax=Monascus purpureus TaxID=5098 RepID=A0A507QGL0_MONPU|nr:hypothetical protein MPDQ_005028 [Monascus purpureus]BDD64006.1 hypothetical protein MAP00_008856 [Monascus purpureus]